MNRKISRLKKSLRISILVCILFFFFLIIKYDALLPNEFGLNPPPIYIQKVNPVFMVFCNEEKKNREVTKKLMSIHSNDSSFYSLLFHLNKLKGFSISFVPIFFSQAQEYLIINSYLKSLEKPHTNS